MKNIGIIGFGFVGRAIAHGFSLHANVRAYDKYEDGTHSLKDTVEGSEFIFVCVPTPADESGEQDPTILCDAVVSVMNNADTRKTIILKSTIVPGTTRTLAELYPKHDFVFNPEFLTQRASKLEFINASRIVIGGETADAEAVNRVESLYRDRFTQTPIHKTTWEGAELVKYMSNCFFSMKISFLNEMYDIAQELGVDFESLRNMWIADYRIGNSHIDVPGHDGKRGYGGKCFPKDVKAFIHWAEKKSLHADMCKTADSVNERVRRD